LQLFLVKPVLVLFYFQITTNCTFPIKVDQILHAVDISSCISHLQNPGQNPGRRDGHRLQQEAFDRAAEGDPRHQRPGEGGGGHRDRSFDLQRENGQVGHDPAHRLLLAQQQNGFEFRNNGGNQRAGNYKKNRISLIK